MRSEFLINEAAAASLKAQAMDVLAKGEDHFLRMSGRLPAVPRDEEELLLMLVDTNVPEEEDPSRSAGPPVGPGSPRERR